MIWVSYFLLLQLVSCQFKNDYERNHYVAVELSTNSNPDQVASTFGFINKGIIGKLSRFYLFEIPKESFQSSFESLKQDSHVCIHFLFYECHFKFNLYSMD